VLVGVNWEKMGDGGGWDLVVAGVYAVEGGVHLCFYAVEGIEDGFCGVEIFSRAG